MLGEKLQHAFKCCYGYLAIHRCTVEWFSLGGGGGAFLTELFVGAESL